MAKIFSFTTFLKDSDINLVVLQAIHGAYSIYEVICFCRKPKRVRQMMKKLRIRKRKIGRPEPRLVSGKERRRYRELWPLI